VVHDSYRHTFRTFQPTRLAQSASRTGVHKAPARSTLQGKAGEYQVKESYRPTAWKEICRCTVTWALCW
jgi:hypothetical protein